MKNVIIVSIIFVGICMLVGTISALLGWRLGKSYGWELAESHIDQELKKREKGKYTIATYYASKAYSEGYHNGRSDEKNHYVFRDSLDERNVYGSVGIGDVTTYHKKDGSLHIKD